MRALTILTAFLLAACASEPEPTGERVAYVNGWIFDGERFNRGALIVEGDRIVAGDPAGAGTQIDLHDGYAIPPLCEAHNHNLGTSDGNEGSIARYLREGIFYVGTLSNLPALTDPVRGTYNTTTSVDTIFGNGGLTASGGHPIPLRFFLLEQGAYPGFTRESLADHAYFVIDNEADLERRWPIITGLRPDFIKIFLLYSEEYEQRRDAETNLKGLNPTLVPQIVERAHAVGLRVFAHIETGHDFHVAVTSGVDVIAHLPGNNTPTTIDPADARLAAERGVPVITTADLIERPRRRQNAELYPRLREAQIANLRTLQAAGVIMAVGSDEFQQTSTFEMAHLRSLNVFSNLELLRMWTSNCATTLFPQRRLGALAPGFEASFIVLEDNPLENLDSAARIELRVKEGQRLLVPSPPEN